MPQPIVLSLDHMHARRGHFDLTWIRIDGQRCFQALRQGRSRLHCRVYKRVSSRHPQLKVRTGEPWLDLSARVQCSQHRGQLNAIGWHWHALQIDRHSPTAYKVGAPPS
eukprot:scaffold52768_cov30-Tisochrysis_lutea.AAC.3